MEGKKNAVTLAKEAIEEALEALEVPSEPLTEDEPIEISGGVKMACVFRVFLPLCLWLRQ
jgi:hypothetical protein